MKQNTTIFDLSKILNLSTSTISRALKDHPDIAAETKKRVRELAEKLDYEPNLSAAGLRTNNTKELAIIVPTLSGFFYDSVISSIEGEARKHGYSLMILVSSDDVAIEVENLKICKQRHVAGVLVCLSMHTKDLLPFIKLLELEIPVIFFDKVPNSDIFPRVSFNDERAASLAANALIKKKKKNILSLFGNIDLSITQRRLTSYSATFNNHFLTANDKNHLFIEHASSSAEAAEIVCKYFGGENKPDAIFCMTDELLIGTMKAVQVLKLSIPDSVGLIAISNGLFPKFYHPEITYVETSGHSLGQLAFSRMLNYLQGNKENSEISAEASLMEGGSL